MSALTDAAETQYKARETAEAEAQDVACKEFRQDALEALRRVLVREDGTTASLTDMGLSAIYTDRDRGLVVASDDVVFLAVRRREDGGDFAVRLVRNDSGWTLAANVAIKSLADLGQALQVAAEQGAL